jgi:ABC-type branched-subunit amino acid transport system substrate-binding protein
MNGAATRRRAWLRLPVAVVAVSALLGASLAAGGTRSEAAAATGGGVVRVASGQPVQVAVVLDTESASVGDLGIGIRNAIEMAVDQRTIRGFPIHLNLFDVSAFVAEDPTAIADNAAAAEQVVSNAQNVAVLGHEASLTFGDVQPATGQCPSPTTDSALSVYEAHDVVTINGSTTNPCLPPIGPTVFNGTAVPGDAFDAWYQDVQALPSDIAWRAAYQLRFGTAATDFADLYYDAANVLVAGLQSVAKIANGNLMIPRSALAEAVRGTTGFCGVTGMLSLDATGYRVDQVGPC